MTQKISKLDILIERMSDCHVKQVKAIEDECFSQPWSKNSFVDSLANPNSYFIVATNYSNVAGYAGMYKIIDEGYIYNIAVKSNFRCMGIGKMLVYNLCSYSVINGLKFLSLEARSSNKCAVAMYKKIGFITLGKRKNFYTNPQEDGLIMTKFF